MALPAFGSAHEAFRMPVAAATAKGTPEEVLMPATRLQILTAVVALGLAGSLAAASPAAAAGPPGPRPTNEGPAGPPARMPDGRVAAPPRVTGALASASCPAVPYGPFSAAPGSGKTVALTFDDGPGASTASILSILQSYGVPATFFNIGENMAAQPQLVRREARTGYMLANHTWDHPDMTTLSAAAQASEMDRASAEQQNLTGTLPCAFRPPGGSYNATTESLAQQRRMKFWTWSVDTEDWKAEGSGSSYWVKRIISLAESEGRGQSHPVVLMHNQPIGNPATVSALPTIIRFFRNLGYTFVDLAGHTRWSTRQASPATAQANGTIDVLYKAADTTLGHRWYVPGPGWQGPASMGTQAVTGEPSVITSVPGTVDTFWQGSDGGLWHQYATGGNWSKQRPLNMGTLGGPPKAVAQPDGSEDVFWRGTDNHLWHAYYVPGSGWHGAQDLGGALASDPAPVASSPGNVDVFWQGTDGRLWHVYNSGGGWPAPVSLGMGPLGSGPAAVGQLGGSIDVFWRGSGNDNLWHAYYQPGSGWHGAQDMGGDLSASAVPAAPVTSRPGTVDVFWRGTDGQLWHVFTTASAAWSAPRSLGMGTLGSAPFATAQPMGAIDVFWRGSGDDHLWHAYYRPGHGWAGAQNLGGHLYPVP
jgi:peptidoglycan/xylan/chitin deacetylase (PgdA/CDA1 family)